MFFGDFTQAHNFLVATQKDLLSIQSDLVIATDEFSNNPSIATFQNLVTTKYDLAQTEKIKQIAVTKYIKMREQLKDELGVYTIIPIKGIFCTAFNVDISDTDTIAFE